MPTAQQILTAMVTEMATEPALGTIYPRPRSANRLEQLAKLVPFDPDGVRGWIPRYLGSSERYGDKVQTVTRRLRFGWTFLLSYSDERPSDGRPSDDVFVEMFEEAAALYRRFEHLGLGVDVANQLLQVTRDFSLEENQIVGDLHVGRCTVDVIVYSIVIPPCT